MDWKTPYVIFRVKGGVLDPVQYPEDLTKAKYWIQYIAEPFDVLCKTPTHPKHSKKTSTPEYWSHKENDGKPAYSENDWKEWAVRQGWNQSFEVV